MKYKNTALVVEGGGLRGSYSGGILDILADKEIKFGGAAGTSAGATHLCSFLSGQIGRNFRIDTIHSKSSRYMSFKNLLFTGDYFAFDYCYKQVPYKIDPFEFDKFTEQCQETEFRVCMTDIETGRAVYPRITDYRNEDEMNYIRASASLPLLSKIVEIHDKKYLDGGVADSIPFEPMFKNGFERAVVILTRPLGYRKKLCKALPLIKFAFRNHPKFVEAVATRHIRYNRALDNLAKLESEGKVFIFRPSQLIKISDIERNKKKIAQLYELGKEDALAQMPALLKFLEGGTRRNKEPSFLQTRETVVMRRIP
ncbi:patatin family protein [Fibrobacter sp.]|uniref:patatin-like phospholipase family protein n=1 Tax=Fibrobacter sp. TaxID=35828 RepID=UPI0025C62A85|nr:patatin family protein [Fibrobacter sp.]MBR3072010.1 patatin family protein [Fibrobacter sp.]